MGSMVDSLFSRLLGLYAMTEQEEPLLGSTTVVERRAFLKSFVKEIQVGSDEMTIQYTLPMPPKQSDEEVIGVLPFIQRGRPYRSRTCDTLIKRYRRIVPESNKEQILIQLNIGFSFRWYFLVPLCHFSW